MIEKLSSDEFRKRLAGFTDASPIDTSKWDDEFSELASDLVYLLAWVFNRDSLDAKTLWSRIDSGIQRALATCDNDVSRLLHICLDHVMATPDSVLGKNAVLIQKRIVGLGPEKRSPFISYLASHRYSVLVGGRSKWEMRKKSLKK